VVKNCSPTNTDPGRIAPLLYIAITRHQLELESC